MNAILFPANTVSEFGSAQSVLSREFLIERGAEGIEMTYKAFS